MHQERQLGGGSREDLGQQMSSMCMGQFVA